MYLRLCLLVRLAIIMFFVLRQKKGGVIVCRDSEKFYSDFKIVL